jgi:hypothetical protein
MKTTAQTTFTERLGRMLGRAWRGCAHLDRRAQGWLHARGWAPGFAKTMMLLIKLAASGVLLYAAFWFAVPLALLLLAAWHFRGAAAWQVDEENKPEWREGHTGFGLYDKNEWRHDMGDPDKP